MNGNSDFRRRVTRSMERQNSNTVEHVTKNFHRVSTDEQIVGPVTVSPPRKHKLSTSREPQQTKKQRQISRGGRMTKELMKEAIKKLLEEKTEKTPQRKRGRSRKKSSPLACTFNERQYPVKATKRVVRCSTLYHDEPSSLEFGGDIEADGAGPSTIDENEATDGGAAAAGDVEHDGSSFDPKIVNEVADKLRMMGDDVNKEATERINQAALNIVKRKAYKKYKEVMELLIDENQCKVNDASERYAVAIVLLLTEKVIAKAKEAMVPTSTLDEVVEVSTEFIQANYPAVLQ